MKNFRTNLIFPLLLGIAVIALITFVVTLRTNAGNRGPASDSRSINNGVKPNVVAGAGVQPQSSSDDDKGVWLKIGPEGFVVPEMTLEAGKYLVIVQNATGLDQFSLSIEKDGKERLYDVRLQRHRRVWKQMIHLSSGTYTVSETDHPEWSCRITVN